MFYRLGKKSEKPYGVSTTSLAPTPALYAQGLIEVEFPIFFLQLFLDLGYRPLNRWLPLDRCSLNGGSTVIIAKEQP